MDQAAFLKKFALSEGDLVRVVKSGTIFEGTVIPSSDADVLVLKLKNGYNAGFDPAALSEVVRLGSEKKAAKPAQKPLPHDPALPTILILHTGGTISSRVNYATGGVFSAFSPSDLLEMFPELMQKSNFETRVVTNILSGSMRFDHYPVIAEEIKKALSQGFAGIIIPHGTDTLSFTSAAMAFMIQDPAVPILFVGAQRSSDRGSSDAAMNLSCAVDFILKGDFAGFAICMHETENDSTCVILPATKTRKMHSSRRDAFKPVNADPIARVGYADGKVEFFSSDYPRKGHGKETVFRLKIEEKTGLLVTTPALRPEQLRFFEGQKYRGLVIEGAGLGSLPILAKNPLEKTNGLNFEALQSLIESGCVVALVTQCLYGPANLHVYSYGRELLRIGVLEGHDMLPETAMVKLAWLLANYKDLAEVKRLFGKNLVGEISEFSRIDHEA